MSKENNFFFKISGEVAKDEFIDKVISCKEDLIGLNTIAGLLLKEEGFTLPISRPFSQSLPNNLLFKDLLVDKYSIVLDEKYCKKLFKDGKVKLVSNKEKCIPDINMKFCNEETIAKFHKNTEEIDLLFTKEELMSVIINKDEEILILKDKLSRKENKKPSMAEIQQECYDITVSKGFDL